MPSLTITTPRLELIAATLEISQAEIHDRARFAALLGTLVPAVWPPPLNDDASMQWFLGLLERDPDAVGWTAWYFVLRGRDAASAGDPLGTAVEPSGRAVIGNGGFTGRPDGEGTVEIGYSLLESYQGKGYAAEGVRALIAWAFGHGEVHRVIAQTFPELTASIRLLETCGFRRVGAGTEERSLRFELPRDRYARDGSARDKSVGEGPRVP